MPQVTATLVNGARVRKENGALLKAGGEPVERNAYWLRRERDGDVTLTAVVAEPVEAVPAAPAAKSKK